jgi:VCBS repeat-containing protein
MRGTKGFGGGFGHHDHHHGGAKGLTLKGTRYDDLLTGGNLDDRLYGGRGDDTLEGSGGRDLLVGGKGNDNLLGGAGDDVLYGDGKGMAWGWDQCVWWTPRPSDNDFLDGGAGSDKVFGGRGEDVLLYSMAGNLGPNFDDIGTHDFYDGGSGFDALRLELTYGEYLLDSVQADIEAFEAFLEAKSNPRGEHGKTFHFQSFDLDARNFEALEIVLVNVGPTAHGDTAETNEDTAITIAPASVLANDGDTDHLDEIAVIDADALSVHGAVVTLGADGSLGYDPGDALALQQLAEGATVVDSFSYTIADLGSEGATATVQVTVTGVNDDPVAMHDTVTLPVTSGGSGGGTTTQTITFEGAQIPGPGETPVVDGFSFEGFSISPTFGEGDFFSFMAYAGTTNNNAGGAGDADGAVRYGSAGEEFGVLSFSIASFFIEPTVTIAGYRDGEALDGAVMTVVVNAAYQPLLFGAAWSNIDELRFYGQTDDGSLDFVLIDNLQVALSSGGGGTPQAAAIDIDVLDNDTDVDDGAVLELLSFDDPSAMGALISQNPDGTLRYDPSGMDLPDLAPGETETDTFNYTVTDEYGATSTASVSVVLTGADADASVIATLGAPDVDLL